MSGIFYFNERKTLMNNSFQLGQKVIMKKKHPCGSNEWEIVRLGADVKIKCLGCERVVMMSRDSFNKSVKKIIE